MLMDNSQDTPEHIQWWNLAGVICSYSATAALSERSSSFQWFWTTVRRVGGGGPVWTLRRRVCQLGVGEKREWKMIIGTFSTVALEQVQVRNLRTWALSHVSTSFEWNYYNQGCVLLATCRK